MTTRNEAKLNMYNAVISFCDDNNATIATLPAFADAVANFNTKVQSLQSMAQQEAQVISGITINKADLKKSLCQVALNNAAALFAYATAIDDAILKEKARYSHTDLFRLKDEELAIIAQNIYDEADSLVANLAGYGITPDTLEDFEELIDDYANTVPAPRNALSQRAASKEQLKSLFNEADNILKDQMDKFALQFKQTNPEFYNTYKNNRVIVDAAVSSTQVSGTVTNGNNENPLSGVTVEFVGLPITTITDTDGTYTLKNPTPGIYAIKASKPEYQDNTIPDIGLSLGQNTNVDISLVAIPT